MRKVNHRHPTESPPQPAPPRRLRVVSVATAPAPARPGDSIARLRPGGDSYPADAYLATLRPSGRRSMRARLDRAAALLLAGSTAADFPWATLTYEDVVYVRTRLTMSEASDSTVNMTLVALRRVAHEARHLGQMPAEVEAALRDVKSVRAERLPRGRMLSPEERDLLFRSCARDPSARGRRDACVLALGLGAGLRREELASVHVSAFDAAARSLRIVGKGGREALLPLKPHVVRAVRAWLKVRGARTGPLLAPVTPEGAVLGGERVSDQAVYRAVVGRARKAGVARCTPHDLRRTFISELLDSTDGETARSLSRHVNFQTTGRYDRRGERAGREAVEAVYVPYAAPSARSRAERVLSRPLAQQIPRPRRNPRRKKRRSKRPQWRGK